MEIEKINTGLDSLDEDLRNLFEIASDPKMIESIKQAIDNRDISAQEFVKIVPLALVRLTLLTNDFFYHAVKTRIKVEAHELVDKARHFIENNFPTIQTHPITQPFIEGAIQKYGHGIEQKIFNVNTITQISSIISWFGKPPELIPTVRVSFLDERDRILLDSTMEWDDLIYMIEALTKIAQGLFECGRGLAEMNLLKITNPEKMAGRINNIQGYLNQIKDLFSIYKIELPSEPAPRKDEEKK